MLQKYKYHLLLIFLFFIISSCQNKKNEAILLKIIELKEQNKITDLKWYLWNLDHKKLEEPFRSIILLEKKWYFLDTSAFNKKYKALDLLLKAKSLSFEEDYVKGNKMFIEYFENDSDILNDPYLSGYTLPFIYEAMVRIRIKPKSFEKYFNAKANSTISIQNRNIFQLYQELFKIEHEIENSDFEMAKIHSQALVAKILNTRKPYHHLLSFSAYKVYWSKLNNEDLNHLQLYKECVDVNRMPTYIRSLFQLAEYMGDVFYNLKKYAKAKEVEVFDNCKQFENYYSLVNSNLGFYSKPTDEEINPTDFQDLNKYINYANFYIKNNNSDKAEEIFKTLLKWSIKEKENIQVGYILEIQKAYYQLCKIKCRNGSLDYCNLAESLIKEIYSSFKTNGKNLDFVHFSDFVNEFGCEELELIVMKEKLIHKVDFNHLFNIFQVSKNRNILLSNALLKSNNLDSKEQEIYNSIDVNVKKSLVNINKLKNKDLLKTNEFYNTYLLLEKQKKIVGDFNINLLDTVNQIKSSKIFEHASEKSLTYIDFINKKESMFVLIIDKKNTIVYKIENIEKLKNYVLKIKNLVRNPNSSIDSIKTYGQFLNNLIFKNYSFIDQNLVICPASFFHNFPFEVLTNNKNQFLLESNQLTLINGFYQNNFSSSSVNPKSISLYGFNDQDGKPIKTKYDELVFTKREVSNIAELLRRENYLISYPNIYNLGLKNIQNSNIFHLAAHAFSDSRSKHGSFFVVRKKGKTKEIYGYEIEKTKINNDLIFLNACKAADGYENGGEGLYSLTNSFLIAGAKNVITTKYNVEDRFTSEFAVEFYKQLIKSSKISNSLRVTQLLFMKNKKYSHPYYWSNYSLYSSFI